MSAETPKAVPLSKLKDGFLDGTSSTYLEELEERYRQDPGSVDKSWSSFFRSLGMLCSGLIFSFSTLQVTRSRSLVVAAKASSSLQPWQGSQCSELNTQTACKRQFVMPFSLQSQLILAVQSKVWRLKQLQRPSMRLSRAVKWPLCLRQLYQTSPFRRACAYSCLFEPTRYKSFESMNSK